MLRFFPVSRLAMSAYIYFEIGSNTLNLSSFDQNNIYDKAIE
jgi:hypothetical protein